MNVTRLSPLNTVAQRAGATFVEIGGWRFAESYSSVEAEMAAARKAVALADTSPHGKIQVEGTDAPDVVAAAFGGAPDAIGAGLKADGGYVYRLRPDQFFVITPPGREVPAQERLESAIRARDAFVTVTDLSQGLAEMRLIGPRAREVLSKVSALDFSDAAFPNLNARQTSLAKTRQLIIRRDFGPLLAFTFAGAQSLGEYVWEAVLEAGREYGITPMGVAAMRELEKD
jgi:sarcosine oxidase subunit alpha